MIVAQTPRLTLRPFALADAAQLAWIYSDPDVMRYIPPGAPWDQAKVERFVAICQERYETPGFGMWAVVLRDIPEKIVGHCGLQHLAKTENVEIAWIFGKEYWNRGLATEAARAVVGYGFGELGLPRIVAVAEPPNGASFRIMQKLAMTLQGPVRYYDRDLTMYALEARDYAAARKAATGPEANK
ncbi:MAG TPA: GNAT family N-acetyltransferase [Candidatus Eremiobacteraceae bacterium]